MFELTDTTHRTRDWLSSNRRQLQRIGLAVAAFCFAVGLFWALWTFPESPKLTAWPLVVLLFLCVPLTTALNVAEFHVMSRVAGVRIGWSASLETTVYASAANMLPLPGSVIARVAALSASGATVRVGSMITVLFAGIWGGTAFCYSGVWLFVLGHQGLGTVFLAAGIALLGACIYAALKRRIRGSLLAQAFIIRCAMLLTEVLRQMLAIWSLGAFIGFGEASVFAVSSFVGSTISIVPAGLGVREFVVAALSPLVSLSPAIGFLSAMINRIVGMIGLAALSTILFVYKRDIR